MVVFFQVKIIQMLLSLLYILSFSLAASDSLSVSDYEADDEFEKDSEIVYRKKVDVLLPVVAPWPKGENKNIFYHSIDIKEVECGLKEELELFPDGGNNVDLIKERMDAKYIKIDSRPDFFDSGFMWAIMIEFDRAFSDFKENRRGKKNKKNKKVYARKGVGFISVLQHRKQESLLPVFFEAASRGAHALTGMDKTLWYIWLDDLRHPTISTSGWRELPFDKTPLPLGLKVKFSSNHYSDDYIVKEKGRRKIEKTLEDSHWVDKGLLVEEMPNGLGSPILWVLLREIESLFYNYDLGTEIPITKKQTVFDVTCFLGREDFCLPFIIHHTLRTLFSKNDGFKKTCLKYKLEDSIDYITRYKIDWRGWLYDGPFVGNDDPEELEKYLENIQGG